MTATESPTIFDAKAAAQLERMYASPQVAAQRRRFREVLAAQPGESGVDVGCGLAHLAIELAQEVGPAGRIVGFDNSDTMVAAAKERIAAAGLGDRIAVSQCDATALDLADASADFVAVAQVYSYVPEVARAIAEAARVLRPGGRLVVLETDWDLCVYESADLELGRRMMQARALHFAHAQLPRQMHRLLLGAGLTFERCEAFPIVETQWDPQSFGAGLLPVLRTAAVKSGLDSKAVEAWIADIRSRSADGEYFFATCRFIFVGRKPTAMSSP